MFYTLILSTLSNPRRSASSPAKFRILQWPRLIFFTGPKTLLTSRITGKCATLMALLLAPSLIISLLLLLPPILFQSPEQHAYFYFAQVLDSDPERWLPMSFAILCTLVAMAIPAAMPKQRFKVSY